MSKRMAIELTEPQAKALLVLASEGREAILTDVPNGYIGNCKTAEAAETAYQKLREACGEG